jgi:hypothetical protein
MLGLLVAIDKAVRSSEMRESSAHNRTEAVLRWSGRLSGHNGHARSRMSTSS